MAKLLSIQTKEGPFNLVIHSCLDCPFRCGTGQLVNRLANVGLIWDTGRKCTLGKLNLWTATYKVNNEIPEECPLPDWKEEGQDGRD